MLLLYIISGFLLTCMHRSGAFRHCRARVTNSKPGPTHVFDIVNRVLSDSIAKLPLELPTLTEVIAEWRPFSQGGAGLEIST